MSQGANYNHYFLILIQTLNLRCSKITKEKEKIDITQNKRVKLFFFADDMIIYLEKSTNGRNISFIIILETITQLERNLK